MTRLYLLTLTLLLSSCGIVEKIRIDERGVCDGLSSFVDRHQEALLVDAGDVSLTSGASLIAAYDMACRDP
jgi:hypothetical protein